MTHIHYSETAHQLCNFFEIALRHGCSAVYLLHIFRPLFPNNTSGRLLLIILSMSIPYQKINNE